MKCANCGFVTYDISRLVYVKHNSEEITLCRACAKAYKTCPTCIYRSICATKTVTPDERCKNCICGNDKFCNKRDKLTCENYKFRWARL